MLAPTEWEGTSTESSRANMSSDRPNLEPDHALRKWVEALLRVGFSAGRVLVRDESPLEVHIKGVKYKWRCHFSGVQLKHNASDKHGTTSPWKGEALPALCLFVHLQTHLLCLIPRVPCRARRP